LALATAAVVFVLIIVGGIVRVSDSGLGCGPEGAGTEGWPLCGGGLLGLDHTNQVVEFSHRVLAAAAAVMVATLFYRAWRHHRDNRPLVRTSGAALGLILFQAALGGLTVEKGLEEELVAIHLGVAMLQIGLVLLIARLSLPIEQRRPRTEKPQTTRAIRVLAVTASALILGTIVAGGYMAATKLEGTDREHESLYAHVACGDQFPACDGRFLPFGESRALDIHLTHRAFMYVAALTVLCLFVVVLAQRRRLDPQAGRDLTRTAAATVGVLAVQIFLGAANVWFGEHAWLVVTHLTVGTLLWISLVLFDLRALDARQPAGSPQPSAGRVEAAPA
jgi:heme A synthase